MEVETATQVGEPKLRLPSSEKALLLSFLSRVQRTTSHGAEGVSVSAWSKGKFDMNDTFLLWPDAKAGDEPRGVLVGEGE